MKGGEIGEWLEMVGSCSSLDALQPVGQQREAGRGALYTTSLILLREFHSRENLLAGELGS